MPPRRRRRSVLTPRRRGRHVSVPVPDVVETPEGVEQYKFPFYVAQLPPVHEWDGSVRELPVLVIEGSVQTPDGERISGRRVGVNGVVLEGAVQQLFNTPITQHNELYELPRKLETESINRGSFDTKGRAVTLRRVNVNGDHSAIWFPSGDPRTVMSQSLLTWAPNSHPNYVNPGQILPWSFKFMASTNHWDFIDILFSKPEVVAYRNGIRSTPNAEEIRDAWENVIRSTFTGDFLYFPEHKWEYVVVKPSSGPMCDKWFPTLEDMAARGAEDEEGNHVFIHEDASFDVGVRLEKEIRNQFMVSTFGDTYFELQQQQDRRLIPGVHLYTYLPPVNKKPPYNRVYVPDMSSAGSNLIVNPDNSVTWTLLTRPNRTVWSLDRTNDKFDQPHQFDWSRCLYHRLNVESEEEDDVVEGTPPNRRGSGAGGSGSKTGGAGMETRSTTKRPPTDVVDKGKQKQKL